MKKTLFFVVILAIQFVHSNVDLLIFSYDRPLQLFALLESIEMNVTGIHTGTVIYRTSSEQFENGYQLVKKTFPHIIFKAQNRQKAAKDFKSLVIRSMFNPASKAQYALFAVDDIIITRPIDLILASQYMEETQSYGFFFRLGFNIDYSYAQNMYSGIPNGTRIESNLFTWKIGDGKGDWKYPNNVDFTLYRKKDIKKFFRSFPFTFPNDLEATWDRLSNMDVRGICYENSCIVNIPMNVVSSFKNRQMNYKGPKELLELFLSGYKIDIRPIQNIKNNSPHFEIEPECILRN